jgi:hypothetical protein
MNTFASRLFALATASLLAACASATPRPGPTGPTGPTQPTPATTTRAPFVTLIQDNAFSTVVPGEAARPSQLRAGPECAETMGIGSSSPVVSPDGRKIAFTNPAGELVVAELENGATTALTRHGGGQDVCVQVTGWSLDGRRLLFHLGESPSEESTPPEGLTQGFFLWEEGQSPRHLPDLESADLVLADGLAVLQVADHPDRPMSRILRRVPLTGPSSPGTSRDLATRDDPYAFGQLHLAGETLAFASRETLEVAPLDNPAAAKIVVKRPFAEAQWPKLSPDGRHLAWHEIPREKGVPKPSLRVSPVAGGEPIALGALTGPPAIEAEWFDDTHLLVCDGQGVRLVALDGKTQPLAGPGACFVPRGAR